jgi:stress response protein YsnF
MISNENLGSIVGAPVVGAGDDRIGTVGQIFVDPVTRMPNWVTVHTGLFGRHESFVPLDEATWDREVLHVPYEKGLVKDAPRIDIDGALDADNEDELYRYYGLTAPAQDAGARTDTDRDRADTDRDAQSDTDAGQRADRGRSPDDTVPQEQVRQGESMRLRKYVVTEERDITVPVSREEVRLEPDPSEEGADVDSTPDQAGESSDDPDRNRKGRHRA